ncbi:MAG: hypothetical protein HKN68_09770 [Saprospiraceae bacterium]|nr:hypothetical protein [Saprospiraceae bacterium]
MMKNHTPFVILIGLLLIITSIELSAQSVGINTTDPDESAALEVFSVDRGFLMPRSDTALVNGIGTPATGLIIYQSSDNLFYYFNGAYWINLSTINGAFEQSGNLVRQVSDINATNFIFGKSSLPETGELLWDTLFFFNQEVGAFRGGMMTNSSDWSPDLIGIGSFAYGNTVNAQGENSIALGNSSFANGDYSVALGRGIITSSGYETAIGRFNSRYSPVTNTGWNDSDRLFSIGNGSVITPSNALTMLKGGEIGLGTDTPQSQLSINGDGATDWTVTIYNDKPNGRAIYGSATNNEYGVSNYGGYFESAGEDGAAVYGAATKTGFAFASGGRFESASQLGHGVYGATSGENGYGVYGIGLGTDHLNYGVYGTNAGSVGFAGYFSGKTFVGDGDFLIGLDDKPDPLELFNGDLMFVDIQKMAFRGGRLTSSEDWSPEYIGNISFAFGENTRASGLVSTAIGLGTSAPSAYETVIGSYNSEYSPLNTTGWNEMDRLFSVGNGTSMFNRRNAITILKNGYIGIGTDSPGSTLEVNGKLKLGDDEDAPLPGAVRYNEETKEFEGYNGSVWLSFTRSYSDTWGTPYSPSMSENERLYFNDFGSNYGEDVSIQGEFMIIGAPNREFSGMASAGSAFVKENLGSTWSFGNVLLPADLAAFDRFGSSVDVYGDVAIVGSPGADISTNDDQGAAYIFKNQSSGWDESIKLTAIDGETDDSYGSSVAIYGNFAVVGCPKKDVLTATEQGVAYVYHFNGSTWNHFAILTASDGEAEDNFGHCVAIYDNFIVVGSPKDDFDTKVDAGSAYIFFYNGSTWSQQARIIAADGNPGDQFGTSVAIYNESVIVGSPLNTVGTTVESGAAYTFGNSLGWAQTDKINSLDPQTGVQFGNSVDIGNKGIVVGEKYATLDGEFELGSAYIFYNHGTIHIRPSNGKTLDHFGTSVTIYENTVAVGSPDFDNGGVFQNYGSVYIFNKK